ncbi:MAG: TonB family protein, partial [Bilophila sp.]
GLAHKITAALDTPPKETPLQDTPVIGSVDTNGGYGAKVLEKLLPYWQPPAGASGVVTISLRIGSNGRPLYCETVKRSGNQILDELPCQAAARAGSFGNPPYGIVTEVFVTLATDRAALGGGKGSATPAAPQRSYAEEIMYRVKPHVQVPPGLGNAAHTVELLLRVSPSGSLENLSVARSSGRQDVDNAVMTALRTPGVLPALPADSPPLELRLLFTVTSN